MKPHYVFVFFIIAVLALDVDAGILHLTHFSQSLKRDRNLSIYLPPGYANTGNYPTVYLLHGYGSNTDNFFWDKTFNLGQLLDTLIKAGTIKPFIVVMPDSSMRWKASGHTFVGSFYVNSIAGAYEDYLIKDVIDYVEDHYSVNSDPRSRTVMGHSMGGLGAMYYALKYGKTMFGAVVVHSGPLVYPLIKMLKPLMNEAFTDGSLVSKLTIELFRLLGVDKPSNGGIFAAAILLSIWSDPAISRILDNEKNEQISLDRLRDLDVLISCGNSDEMHLYPFNRIFSGQLTLGRIRHTFLSHDGNHANKLQAMLVASLIHLGKTDDPQAKK